MGKIFLEKTILDNKKLKSILTSINGWYDVKTCEEQIIKERNRISRSGAPLTYVLIDLSIYSDDNYIISEKNYGEFIEKFLNIISNNTRDYDIKCLRDIFKIEIYLVETNIDGAKVFTEKISNESFRYFEARGKKEFIKLIRSVSISSCSLTKHHKFESMDGSPTIIKNYSIESIPKNVSNNLQVGYQEEMKEKSDLHIDWNLKASPDGTLVIGSSEFINVFHFFPKDTFYLFLKRFLDIIGSTIGIILFLPVMMFIAVAIKVTSRGPVLFKQKRVGYHGKEFNFFKFRSMKYKSDDSIHQEYVKKLIKGKSQEINQGNSDNPVFKISNDPRITSIGHILRKTSLDELPQFLNVLKGDMSLVGPRPPIPYELESYQPWHLRRVLEVKPGITGLWQVYGRSRTTFDEMVRLDLQYVSHRNLLLDIKLLLKTLTLFFDSEGAY
jgi:lipopolysaccharide/colanic/teichoic acid biosynthesis glycosyltransferase